MGGGSFIDYYQQRSTTALYIALLDSDNRNVPNLQYQVKLTEAKYLYNVIAIKHPILPLGPYLIQNVLQILFSSSGFTSCLCCLLFIYNVLVLIIYVMC